MLFTAYAFDDIPVIWEKYETENYNPSGTIWSAGNSILVLEGTGPTGAQVTLSATGNQVFLYVPKGAYQGEFEIVVIHGNTYAVNKITILGQTKSAVELKIGVGESNRVSRVVIGDYTVNTGTDGNPATVVPTDPDVFVDVNFIGYYLHEGKVLSTSIYSKRLIEGEVIDWHRVFAAYEEWHANGGLPISPKGWQTTGSAYMFFEGARPAAGFDELFDERWEAYNPNYYMSPGYVLPDEGTAGTGNPASPGNTTPDPFRPGNPVRPVNPALALPYPAPPPTYGLIVDEGIPGMNPSTGR
jgi:hypothetical protein